MNNLLAPGARGEGGLAVPQRLNFDFEAFFKELSATVAVRGITWKMVSEQTGVSQSTLSRMSKGRQPDAASLTALSAWSGLNPVDFTTTPKNDPESVVMVSRLLRADPDLDEAGADALEAIITTAYQRLKRPSSNS